MIVLVIIDSSAMATGPIVGFKASENLTATAVGGMNGKGIEREKEKEKTSILDLQSVEITSEGKVVRWKYMERFPFQYYLVVRDVRELPGVLSGALRQWFAEVVDSSG